MNRLNVVTVTSELPWPLNTGGHIRSYHLLTALARRFSVRLVTPLRERADEGLAALRQAGIEVDDVRLPPRRRLREGVRALWCAASRTPYVLYGRHHEAAVARALHLLLERDTDVVYLDHLDAASFRPPARLPIVLDMHNIYSTLVERASLHHNNWAVRAYLRREARLLTRAEAQAVRRARRVLAVSESDAHHFSAIGAPAVDVVPNGVDCGLYASLPLVRRRERVVLYVGALDWPPNAEAALFLVTNVLPALRRHNPATTLRVIGKNPPESLRRAAGEGVQILGPVPDMLPHLTDAAVLAVPLEAGGGTRLKILEAFAAGVPVVSTRIGCEGIACLNGLHLLVAERHEFVATLEHLLGCPALGHELARSARQLVEQRYDWRLLGQQACEAVRRAAQEGPR